MKFLKKLLCLLLVLALLPGFPAKAQAPEEPDYAAADAIFDALEQLPRERNTAARADAVYSTLLSQKNVVPGSVAYQGTDRIVWRTTDGISCVWSDYYEEIAARCIPAEDIPEQEAAEPQAITHGKDVYLIEPYYGIDQSFTGQYQREALEIANKLGGHYFLRDKSNATIDKVAQALENGGLVIFDSHGNTDYKSGQDCVSGATKSYLCLSTTTGITAQDYEDGHVNYSTKGGIVFCEVDGVAISNHMKKDASHSMIWAAICLGMATDGLCRPLMERGVDVMYGYSQSVSFAGDYVFEAVFFDNMLAGRDVAASIADMKDKCGCWDYSPKMGIGASFSTIEQARKNWCAFPIVASQEDAYPGHGNVDDLQEVKSTWRLVEYDNVCRHLSKELRGYVEPTCTADGYSGDLVCKSCGTVLTPGQVLPAFCPSAAFSDVKTNKWYHAAVDYVAANGIMKGSGGLFSPSKDMTRAELATIFWNLEGKPMPEGKNPFSDVKETYWGRNAIVWAAEAGIVTGSGGKFKPGDPVTREQVAVMLCRYAGGEAPQEDLLAGFTDGAMASKWAVQALNWAVDQGVLKGSAGKLNPKGNITRAEVAQVMMNFLG